VRVQRRDVIVERVDGEAEREIALVLGGAPRQDEQAGRRRPRRRLAQQRRLADAGLAEDADRPRAAAANRPQGVLERLQLAIAPDQLLPREAFVHPPRLGPAHP